MADMHKKGLCKMLKIRSDLCCAFEIFIDNAEAVCYIVNIGHNAMVKPYHKVIFGSKQLSF